MTTTRWMAALVALLMLFLALPSPAHAQVARRTFRLWTGTAADTTAVGMADSTGSGNATGVMSTALYQRLYLRIKPNRPCRVAIQVREYGISDTSNTSVPSDSSQGVAFIWKGPRIQTTGTDSTSLITNVVATSVQAGSDELVIEFPDDQATAGGKWGGPRGKLIPICSSVGGWYWGQYTTLRVRVLSAGGVVTWIGSVKGISW